MGVFRSGLYKTVLFLLLLLFLSLTVNIVIGLSESTQIFYFLPLMNKITQDPTEQFHAEKQILTLRKHTHLHLLSGSALGPREEMPASHGHKERCAGQRPGCPELGGWAQGGAHP